MTELPPPPPEGRALGLISAVKGMTVGNVVVIAMLAVIAVPVYVVYKALSNDKLLDRLMSTYEVIGSEQGCAVRHVQERGGPDLWGVSSGFAFQGDARWYVNVILDHAPAADEIATYCASLKLIADRMLERGNEVHPGSVPGTAPDGSRYGRDLPTDRAPRAEEEN